MAKQEKTNIYFFNFIRRHDKQISNYSNQNVLVG